MDNEEKKSQPEGRDLVDLCARELFARKAEEVVLLELKGISDVCDSFLIATCRSEVQMRAILNGLRRELRRQGVRPLGTDFETGARWAVLDLGELMVHLFEEEHRKYFSLERLYQDGGHTALNAADYPMPERNLLPDEEEGDLNYTDEADGRTDDAFV